MLRWCPPQPRPLIWLDFQPLLLTMQLLRLNTQVSRMLTTLPLFQTHHDMIFVQALSSGSLSLRIITSQSSPSCSIPSLPTSTSGELRMTNQFRPIQTCSRLLVHCAPTVAGRFHKRHLATFLGNPEFKLFIQQLAEVGMLYHK